MSWDPTVLRNWWFKLAPGGVMALHNTVGQHDKEGEPGWAWGEGDLDRALRAALPSGEKWELLTFQEPHKVYQGSFSVVRRVGTVAERAAAASEPVSRGGTGGFRPGRVVRHRHIVDRRNRLAVHALSHEGSGCHQERQIISLRFCV